jgi:hypothetical protein
MAEPVISGGPDTAPVCAHAVKLAHSPQRTSDCRALRMPAFGRGCAASFFMRSIMLQTVYIALLSIFKPFSIAKKISLFWQFCLAR